MFRADQNSYVKRALLVLNRHPYLLLTYVLSGVEGCRGIKLYSYSLSARLLEAEWIQYVLYVAEILFLWELVRDLKNVPEMYIVSGGRFYKSTYENGFPLKLYCIWQISCESPPMLYHEDDVLRKMSNVWEGPGSSRTWRPGRSQWAQLHMRKNSGVWGVQSLSTLGLKFPLKYFNNYYNLYSTRKLW